MEKSLQSSMPITPSPEPLSAQAASSHSAPVSENAEKKKKRTVGNIIYDVGIFGSIAWVGVAALSAFFAHEANVGKNPMFNWWRGVKNTSENWLNTKLFSKILPGAEEKTVKGLAGGTTMFLTLGMGGNLLMAPLKWMEDNRQKNAARIDHLLGTTPPDPETIAAEPKQTWKSVLSGRLASWGTSYLVFLGLGPERTGKLNTYFENKATESIMKRKPHWEEQKVRNWANVAAFDAIFTVITCLITYGFSRFVARKDDARKQHHETDVPVQVNSSAPADFTTAFFPQKEEKKEKEPSSTPDTRIHAHGEALQSQKLANASGLSLVV